MAAFAQHARPTTPASSRRNDLERRSSTSERPLPCGPCNFRDLSHGNKAPTCGCRRFWRDGGERPHPRDDTEQLSDHNNKPWCICGHHACYHDAKERCNNYVEIRDSEARSALNSPAQAVSRAGTATYVHLIPCGGERQYQLVGSQSSRVARQEQTEHARGARTLGAAEQPGTPRQRQQDTIPDTRRPSLQGAHISATRRSTQRDSPRALPVTASQANTSDLPPIPSVCLVNSDDLRSISAGNAGLGPQQAERLPGSFTADYKATGLGLSMQGGQQNGFTSHQSPSPTVADDITTYGANVGNDSRPPSTRPASADVTDPRISLSRTFMDHILQSRARPPLDVSYSLPHGVGLEDLLQSATEVATPSNGNTPDLRGLAESVHDTKALIDVLARNSPAAERTRETAGAANQSPAIQFNEQSAQVRTRLSPSKLNQQGSYQAALRGIPSVLQRLVPHLQSLHDHITTYPNISTSIKSLVDRIDALENISFSHVPAEELHDRFEHLDGRLIEVEGRMDDHDKLHAAIDADQSSRSNMLFKRRGPVAAEAASFASNHSFRSNASIQSASSSALIAAAIDRVETEAKLKDVEQRLEDLETSALPSHTHPWEIEIVFLPWGRELRGIWSSPDDSIRQNSRVTTQDSEEWTQTRASRFAETTSAPLRAAERNGWSEQDIHDWADAADEWLSPKACGINSVVYRRLRSRGFVRTVTLQCHGAREVQAAICAAFGELPDKITVSDADSTGSGSSHDNTASTTFLGLKAPIIPLRKVHKSSRLLFLSPSEMVTPALWTADFLSSSVIMRAIGGQKRLFVTHREAYLQANGDSSASWTWQRLRELPRVRSTQDGAVAASPNHVAEADAKEECWAYHPNLDPLPSAHSSFASHASIFSSDNHRGRPASTTQEKLPQSYGPPPQDIVPISPLSEFPSRKPPRHRRTRTRSVPLTEIPAAPQHNSQPKRRIASFDTPSAAPTAASRPASTHKPRIPKRRRLTRSPEVAAAEATGSNGAAGSNEGPGGGSSRAWGWGLTPRRSKEPPSPFFVSSHPATGSDGRSQNTATTAATGQGVAQAYATPYSGTVLGAVGGVGRVGEFGVGVGAGGDTEVDSESGMDEDDDGEDGEDGEEDGREGDRGDDEVWEGVEEEMEDEAHYGAKWRREGSVGVGAERDDSDDDDRLEHDDSDSSGFEEEMDEG